MENYQPLIFTAKPKNNALKLKLPIAILFPFFSFCQQNTGHPDTPVPVHTAATIEAVPLPEGYRRTKVPDSSFAGWLRRVALKKDKRVFLYDGSLKRNQSAQYAVLDIPVGKKDLQQCADAIMRLRAEYLYSYKRFKEISFSDNNRKKYICPQAINRTGFERYLENVFAWCGTLSLEKQLHPVRAFSTIRAGDVLIKGGSPGHAVMVVDIAKNSQGQTIFLLAQSYMPAQDIHLLVNPRERDLSPWYTASDDNPFIHSPEWTFRKEQLRRW